MSLGVVAVAASGGRDSTALLHVTARLARDAGLRVLALHVHHGLMPQADAWQRHLQKQCARWRRRGLPVEFACHRLPERPAPGESVEAWARKQRYRALAQMAREAGAAVVLLAHHRRDQAETFVLQALRGGSPKGLAAMPSVVLRDGLCWCRPWLNHPVSAIEAYVRRHRLTYVEDSSNHDPRFARSRLRTQVWPPLLRAFGDADAALHAAAHRAQESAACLAELAQLDAQRGAVVAEELQQAPWMALSSARRANLLRHWLQERTLRSQPSSLIERLMVEWPAAGAGHRWPARGGQLHSAQGRLLWVAEAPPQDGTLVRRPQWLDLSVPGVYDVPGWGGQLGVQTTAGPGIPAAWLQTAELRRRQGREQFQARPSAIARSLKKQFQAADVPVHGRAGPLVFVRGQLAFVPGLGLDARVCLSEGEALRSLSWHAQAALLG